MKDLERKNEPLVPFAVGYPASIEEQMMNFSLAIATSFAGMQGMLDTGRGKKFTDAQKQFILAGVLASTFDAVGIDPMGIFNLNPSDHSIDEQECD